MIIRKFFRLMNDIPGDTGGADTADRGDLLPEPAPAVDPAETPAVKALEVDLGLGEGEDDKTGEEGKDEGEKSAETDDKPAAKDTRIPAARHKEILEKERAKTAAALAENALLKQRGQLATTTADASAEFAALDTQIETLEAEYAGLLTDGEVKKAGEVMKKIRAAERYMAESKADMKIQAATLQAQESQRFQTALTRVEAAYPVLNPDHEDYSEVTEARVSRLNRANLAAGMSQVAALQDAVEAILGAETPQQEKATSVTPRAEKNVGAERKAAAVAKTVAAVAKTPASLARAGLDSDKLGGGEHDAAAVMKMSQAQFAALSDETLSKMRGDTL